MIFRDFELKKSMQCHSDSVQLSLYLLCFNIPNHRVSLDFYLIEKKKSWNEMNMGRNISKEHSLIDWAVEFLS